jgi:hypothetical protein
MIASDNASNYNPTLGYVGYNGGSGFQAWTGTSASFIGTTDNDPAAIQTNGVNFVVWSGGQSGVARPFLADDGSTNNVALDVGQSVSVDFAMRRGDYPGPKGITLGSSTSPLFTFQMGGDGTYTGNDSNGATYSGTDTDYEIIDSRANPVPTTYAIETGDPTALTFTLTSPTTYSLTVQDLASTSPQATYTTTGTIATGDISQLTLFQAGPSNNDFQFNNLAVTPEPGSLALLSLGGAALMVRRRSQ